MSLDMSRQVTIEVTADHIARARENQQRPNYNVLAQCAVALAASETLGHPTQVGILTVGRDGTIVDNDAAKMRSWIWNFDIGEPVEPISFIVEFSSWNEEPNEEETE